MNKNNKSITDSVNEDNQGTTVTDGNKAYEKADFLIAAYLIQEKVDKINELEETKSILENQLSHSKNEGYHVQIWVDGLKETIDKPYNGSITKVVNDAEKEFKKINHIPQAKSIHMLPGTFNVYLLAGKEKLHLPTEYWEQFRK